MRGMRSYVTSYTLRSNNSELFTIHLNRQFGFYQISEFSAPDGQENFIIEQTNRVGAPKIAAFDKDSGTMLGVLKGNTLLDANESPIMQIKMAADLTPDYERPVRECRPDDWVGVLEESKKVAVLFSRLESRGFFRRIITNLSKAPADVLNTVIIEDDICDIRMIYAVAVVLHSRGGLHLEGGVIIKK